MNYKYIRQYCSKKFELGHAYSNHIKSHNNILSDEDSSDVDEFLDE